jgi:hypothetical protein
VLGQQATEGQAGYNSNLSGAVAEGSQAMGGQQAQQGMNQQATQQGQQNTQKFASGILSAVSGAGTLPGASESDDDKKKSAGGWTPSPAPGGF